MLVKSKAKYIQTLGQKKFRDQEGLFVAEGPKLVEELLSAERANIQEIFALPEWISKHKSLTGRIPVTEVSEVELQRISQLSTSNTVIAVVGQFEAAGEMITAQKITLALDDIRDPGNMGTILRIADWFGIDQLVCSRESADIYNPKVVQASMGSIARVNVMYTDLEEWLAKQSGIRIFAAALEGQSISGMKKITEGIIIIGNESKGIRSELLQLANVRITITGKGRAESLNAAVATGIILSHLT